MQVAISDLNTTDDFNRLLKLEFKFHLTIVIMDLQCPRVVDFLEYVSLLLNRINPFLTLINSSPQVI